MKRTFNYTGRKRIEHSDISVTLKEVPEGWSFDADLRLEEYSFPWNAEVWVEAHRQNLWMQFPWGTISALRPPENRQLSEFVIPDGVLFRVRVVQPAGPEHHKLLGEADGVTFITLEDGNARVRPLLQTVGAPLGHLSWRLDFETDPPQLLVNEALLRNWRDVAKSREFTCLVYPEVLRQLLARGLLDGEYSEGDEDCWVSKWVAFSTGVLGMPSPPSDDTEEELREWIEEAVSAFAYRNQLLSKWNSAYGEDNNL